MLLKMPTYSKLMVVKGFIIRIVFSFTLGAATVFMREITAVLDKNERNEVASRAWNCCPLQNPKRFGMPIASSTADFVLLNRMPC